MEQVQIQAPQTRNLLETSVGFYQDLLGYAPEQTTLQQIPENQWNEFATQRGLNPNSSGIYLPRNQTAVIRDENSLSLFHEYFGHGLYCEQNLTGRKLIDLERRLLEEEKQEFSNSRFTLEDLQRFRKQNQTFQELENFRQKNLERYELFAIWTEHLLSGENKLTGEFGRKYDSLSGQEEEAVDSVINFSSQYGNLATFYAQGMARRTTPGRTRRLLKNIYKDKLQDIKFALLYGSRKEFSDIDIFIVSDSLQPIINDWLDIRVQHEEEFKWRLKHFDISVTDPLFTGETMAGDKKYVNSTKSKIQKLPISEEAILFNKYESKRHKDINGREKENNKYQEYAMIYDINAKALANGLRLFTKNELVSYSQKRVRQWRATNHHT